ncbi:calcium/proton exchanger [Actinomadura barringtoniae]|uniref:Ca(2+)/H(+) antiporter n=1 Tax=Actinomadura barringtoniae TaxID=1427535 RepID=A0A939T3V3_9ACTN|nr:calcium/proton exchanger [Actinomadura barringtoniae]MBO2447264.1 calcium/proton exchanger [Actinomadura barringtoniae]
MGLTRSDYRMTGLAVVVVLGAAITYYGGLGGDLVPFIVSGVALALLASLVGRSVEALGGRLGAGATGVVQSALGNLPELFVVLFALKSGLYEVARATIVGSILANVLLVLGLAFLVGGIKNGSQKFEQSAARTISMLLVLSVAALVVPALTAALHSPAAGHERGLSIVVSILLLGLFIASLPAALKRQKSEEGTEAAEATAEAEGAHEGGHEGPGWPLWLAITMLAVAGVGAAFVSDWFVAGLTPAMDKLGISEAFAGLVIVAIAGNAVENVVGIQLAARNQADYALSVILQSPLQITLVVAPALVLLSPLVGASFTLVLSPLLIAALILAVVVTIIVVLDGESNWLEGAALIVLYAIIAASFWWG